jgi:glycine hydroxymethyltransferase
MLQIKIKSLIFYLSFLYRNMKWIDEANFIRDKARKSNELFARSLPMIASENILSPMCREMLLTDFHGRYAEGTPGQRYYQGCKYFDEVEMKAMELAKKLFKCNYADVRPTAGTTANMGTFKAFAKPGDPVVVLDTANGAHISYGKWGAAGLRGLKLISFPFNDEEMNIDVDGATGLIKKVEPKMILLGRSVFLFPTPLKEISDAAREEGAVVLYDAAHVLGLIGGGKFQDPLREGADVVTGSTHKTLPGPQGGIVLSDKREDGSEEEKKFLRKLGFGVFPGVTSSYHLHHVAAKAIAFAEHLEFGGAYASQIIKNARKLGQCLCDEGFRVFGEKRGFTESHQILIQIGKIGEKKGKWAAERLEKAGIITNMNMVPGDEDPRFPSGLRLGVQELTRVGMKEGEMEDIAKFFKRVLVNEESTEKIRKEVAEFRSNYQKIHYCFHEGMDAYEFHELI